jgi:hypothetical protein
MMALLKSRGLEARPGGESREQITRRYEGPVALPFYNSVDLGRFGAREMWAVPSLRRGQYKWSVSAL